MQFFKLKVTSDSPGKLGRFLQKNGFSKRAIINSNHHQGMILVNHKRRHTSFHLKKNDEVIFILGQEKENSFLKPSNKKVNIVFETNDYLIVNKEAGVLSIPSRYEDSDAVVNRLLSYLRQENKKAKPHIVTRLDRDTSGLVLVGKNSVAQARFSEMNKKTFIKKYHAIVHGNFAQEELVGVIDEPIGKKDETVKRYVVASGKPSQTKYRVLAQKKGASLVELQLFTGRTHQIRVHMEHLGHPLYGDTLYGIKDNFKRQALHCFLLSYPDPFTSKEQQIEIPDPEDMKNLWNSLDN
ncbi:RluA family pseudouridine synthase [Lactobacillus sp. PV037]|uniref:RluA family pseudouridine synthase n=1 Tax=Lactobacillus sp. PV037 TaxID=2594496 RepID=UPI00223F4D78|nr:RluA family pseudouridine synthase [Lactobacillus sp. PV037]QNQ83301.1 RluA family pseudouridine synthase [Lactobacillus sp. PV037]